MKYKLLLFLILNLINISISLCQIYISDKSYEQIIVGPNSISENEEMLAPYYIETLNDVKGELISQIDEEQEILTELKDKEKLRNKEKRRLLKSEELINQIENEINAIDSILNIWLNLQALQESLIEASELIETGKCIEFRTERGQFYSDELKIEIKKSNDRIEYKELIPAEYELASTKWVKKKAKGNCLSSDPDECLVLCLVEVKEGYKIKDYTGKEYKYDYCPSGFEYDEENKSCFRDKSYNEDNEQVEYVFVSRNRSNETLTVLDWKLIECD